jgi:hypothetical protein
MYAVLLKETINWQDQHQLHCKCDLNPKYRQEDHVMSDRKQVTIRAVKTVTYDRLREVKEASRIPLGALLDEAVEQWWHGLPEAEEA